MVVLFFVKASSVLVFFWNVRAVLRLIEGSAIELVVVLCVQPLYLVLLVVSNFLRRHNAFPEGLTPTVELLLLGLPNGHLLFL